MKSIEANRELVAYCGLYCGACKKYLNEKCPGCTENKQASWCGIRKCCKENHINSCADCKKNGHENCKEFNNIIGKIFGLIFNSDRKKCIEFIKNNGYSAFTFHMTENKIMTFKRK